MIRSIKYELKLTKGQAKKLNQSFGNCRFVYNWALSRKIKAYQEEERKLSCFDLMKELTQVKKKEEFGWLNLSGSQQLQQSISNLDNAFTNFFKAKKGFPKFKKKQNRQSFRIPQNVKVDYEKFKFFIANIYLYLVILYLYIFFIMYGNYFCLLFRPFSYHIFHFHNTNLFSYPLVS